MNKIKREVYSDLENAEIDSIYLYLSGLDKGHSVTSIIITKVIYGNFVEKSSLFQEHRGRVIKLLNILHKRQLVNKHRRPDNSFVWSISENKTNYSGENFDAYIKSPDKIYYDNNYTEILFMNILTILS
jgi:hypothetical protein